MDTRGSYDRVAAEYAARISDELRHKPLDRALLDRLADRVRPLIRSEAGPAVCDLGCGPGQVARYLRDRGLPVVGVDLSPGMVERARELNPDIPFEVGDMRALGVPDGTWAGVAAFYSIIHTPRDRVVDTLREIRRVLLPAGWLLLAFHLGGEVRHLAEWWGRPVDVDFVFFGRAEMEGYLQAAGFLVAESLERDPYPDVEYQGRRAYIFAQRPAAPPPPRPVS